MQIAVKFFKVLGEPTEPVPHAVYFVESGDAVEIFVTDADGVVKNAGSPALVQALMDASDAFVYKGAINASTNPNYPAASAGHTYRFSVAGKIGGGSGVNVTPGDMMICVADGSIAGNHATVGANWNVIERNLDGAVIGPASAVHNRIALFNGGTGKLLKDSGVSLNDLAPIDSPQFTGNPKSNGELLIPESVLTDYAFPRAQGIVTSNSAAPVLLINNADKFHRFTREGGATAELPTSGLVIGRTRFFVQFTGGLGAIDAAGNEIECPVSWDAGKLDVGALVQVPNILQYAVAELLYVEAGKWVLIGTFMVV